MSRSRKLTQYILIILLIVFLLGLFGIFLNYLLNVDEDDNLENLTNNDKYFNKSLYVRYDDLDGNVRWNELDGFGHKYRIRVNGIFIGDIIDFNSFNIQLYIRPGNNNIYVECVKKPGIDPVYGYEIIETWSGFVLVRHCIPDSLLLSVNNNFELNEKIQLRRIKFEIDQNKDIYFSEYHGSVNINKRFYKETFYTDLDGRYLLAIRNFNQLPFDNVPAVWSQKRKADYTLWVPIDSNDNKYCVRDSIGYSISFELPTSNAIESTLYNTTITSLLPVYTVMLTGSINIQTKDEATIIYNNEIEDEYFKHLNILNGTYKLYDIEWS